MLRVHDLGALALPGGTDVVSDEDEQDGGDSEADEDSQSDKDDDPEPTEDVWEYDDEYDESLSDTGRKRYNFNCWEQLRDELSFRFWIMRLKFRKMSRNPLSFALFITCVLYGAWCLIASILFVVAKETYEGGVADNARRRYVAICAQRVAAEAASVFRGALAVYEGVDYAVQRKLFYEPLDYDTLIHVLAGLFAAHGGLRAVDLAFIGRSFSFSARRLWRRSNATHPNFTEPLFLLQSNASDCFSRLGARGCLSAVPGRDQPWYRIGASLSGGQEAEAIWRPSYNPVQRSLLGSSFAWLDGPRMVPRDKDTSTLADSRIASGGRKGTLIPASMAWEPAYSLVFRSTFPGTSGLLSVVGRSMLQLRGLAAGGRLEDLEMLGPQGMICIIDRKGTLVATPAAGDLLFVQADIGRPRFRRIWELDTPWARAMQGRKLGDAGLEVFDAEGFVIAVAVLSGRGMDQFRVVVAAELEPFFDWVLKHLLEQGIQCVYSLYPGITGIFLIWYGYRWYKRRKARVHPEPSSPWQGEGDEASGRPYSSGMSALHAAAMASDKHEALAIGY